MLNFTPDEVLPSESTLEFIRSFARTFRVDESGHIKSICLN